MPTVGFLGTVMLLSANALLITPWARFFPPVSGIACVLLAMHAVKIKDKTFTFVNAFIAIVMAIRTGMDLFK